MNRLISLTTAAVLTAATTAPTPPPSMPGRGPVIAGKVTTRGLWVSAEQIDPAGTRPSRGAQAPPQPSAESAASPASAVEVRVVIDCSANTVDGPDETFSCQSAIAACERSGEGPGPRATIYTRPPGTDRWTPSGTTCHPTDYPAAPAPGVLTLADIQRAFHETPFATPIGTIQPPGGTTLVNLPTYFALTWPDTGYRPGQTRTLTLLGRRVDLHLKLVHHTYDFADGTHQGPTTSPGGPYPTGDITHTYRHPTTLTPTADTTLTADFRIDTGPWQPLPGTSVQTTAFPTLSIRTATNRLHPDPS